ncbi:hypothetical protein L7F22_023202 [Adiantum nelumboides]|nr:hypothetical protein [Adiantum nelumboides]
MDAERALNYFRDLERLERLMPRVAAAMNEARDPAERLRHAHCLRFMIDDIVVATTNELIPVLEQFNSGCEGLCDDTVDADHMSNLFYTEMQAVVHRRRNNLYKHQELDIEVKRMDGAHMLEQTANKANHMVSLQFTDEEAIGKFLDLHGLYNQFRSSDKLISRPDNYPFPSDFHKGVPWSNLEDIQNPKFTFSFSLYLQQFPCIHLPNAESKLTQDYSTYLSSLMAYLTSFYERTHPLEDIRQILASVEATFVDQWKNCVVHGWEHVAREDMLGRQLLYQLNIQNLNTWDSLIELGSKRLRCVLVTLGLKSGGTIEQRAKRLLLAKQHPPLQKLDFTHSNSYITIVKEVAIKEMKVERRSAS